MDEDKIEKEREEEVKRLARRLKKMEYIMTIVLVMFALALSLLGLNPFLATMIAILVIVVPTFMVSMKLDRLLGIRTFGRIRGVPRTDVIRLALIGSVNLAIFVISAVVGSPVLSMILFVVGVLMFFTLTLRQGERIAHIAQEVDVKSLPPEKQKMAEEVFGIVRGDKSGQKKEGEDE
jgi:4-hydroxybenzoate polyprenyltransferase